MARENREAAIKFLLEDEGKELRQDRAKATVYGVNASQLSYYRSVGVSIDDLLALRPEAAADYHRLQWERHELDKFPSGLDYFMLDCGVCCGYDVASRWLTENISQRINIGDYERLADITYYWLPERVAVAVEAMSFARRRRHKTEPGWLTYGAARTNRVNRAVRRSLQMTKSVELNVARAS